MVNVNIKFNNKDYLLSCDKGQETNLKKLANHLDTKYSELKKKSWKSWREQTFVDNCNSSY